MSQTLAVAARELRERWLFFPGGLACGFFPLVLPAFGIPVDVATVAGVFGAIFLGMGGGLIAGASMLARDSLDGRLGFLFSRPVPWPAIWGGKWLAAIVLAGSTAVLTALPWMLVFPPRPGGSWGAALLDPQGASFFFVLLLLTIGLANFNATVFRSRSAWAAVDLGLLLLATWLVWRWVAPLYSLHIVWPFLSGSWGFLFPVGPIALALVVASAAQVAVGRTDLRRAHRAMSVAFWSIIFLSLVGAGLRLAWARAAQPSDLKVHAGAPDPSGRWLYVFGGSRRGGAASFLVDSERGRYLPMGLAWSWPALRGMAFSGDGRAGATLVRDSEFSTLDLVDLSGDEPRFTRVELESSPPADYGVGLALSASGSTVLLNHGHGASLFAVPSGRRIATAIRPPGWRTVATRFLGESAARIWLIPIGVHRSPSEMRILDFGTDREARTSQVSLAAPLYPVRGRPRHVHPDAEGLRFLSRDGGVRLRDGATGTLLATLVETTAPVSTAFLADGRIVVGEAVGAQIRLHVFSREGTPVREATLDRLPLNLCVGPEVAPGRVAVHSGAPFLTSETLIFDLAAGGVVETLPGVRPAAGFWWRESSARPAGAPVSTVHFFARGGDLVRLDFATGERRVVAGHGAPRGKRLEGP